MADLPMSVLLLLGCGLVVLASWGATAGVHRLLVRHAVMDRPNHRSSHTAAKPRGGGLALVPIVLGAWAAALFWLGTAPPGFAAVAAGAAALAAVSWLDDLHGGLPIAVRLAVQVAAVVSAIGLGFAGTGPVFQGLLPPLLDRLAAAVLWLWFVNLFNFMDGIDGISGVETGALGAGLALVAWLAGLAPPQVALPALLAAAALGFLILNWEPAKIFLGDVGSVPLGYLLGWLLLLAAAHGQWAAAIVLPLYYFADATLTLVQRVLRGDTIWRAHRDHFYQRAVRRGESHASVTGKVLACNVVLIGCAVVATLGFPVLALIGAGFAVALLLIRLGAAPTTR